MGECLSCSAAIADDARFCPHCGSAQAATTPIGTLPPLARGAATSEGRFVPGKLLIGRFRIVALLGRGGMGEVYRAEDTKLGQTVALKFLPEGVARDPATLERFFAEVRIGRQVSHPNVCRMYDLFEVDGQHCLSMEFVDGEDLATLLKRIGRLPGDKSIEFARELCAGLAAAHDKGVIHRDLKPANIMIDGNGRARITDFGIAALGDEATAAGFAGTPAYMAPEQLDGQPASVRSDLFALGLVLFESFTGRRLFDARTLNELRELHAASDAPSFSTTARDIPPELEAVVRRCLRRDPAQRPDSVRAVIAGLPGGDPLEAALAAGETPTPAMVAAAGAVGELSPARAWSALAAGLAALLSLMWLAQYVTLIGRLRPPLSPAALIERAHGVLERIGYDTTGNSVFFFGRDDMYAAYARHRNGALPPIETAKPGVLTMYYRQRSGPLVTQSMRVVGFPADVGRVGTDDPPFVDPGEIEVALDSRGFLTGIIVVPPERLAAPETSEPDWAPLFAASGLDPKSLASVAPRYRAPFETDRHVAWDARYEGQPGVPIHVEAGALRGRVCWFEVRAPWYDAETDIAPTPFTSGISMLAGFTAVVLTVGIAFMGRRNLREGRGDRAGARRLAFVIAATTAIALLIRADHARGGGELDLLSTILAATLLTAFWSWLFYLAVEPAARRRWPAMLISWSRLLAGRIGDPMVGRDLLLGTVAGVVFRVLVAVGHALPPVLGFAEPSPHMTVISTLGAERHVLYFFFIGPLVGVVYGLGALGGLVFFRALLRSDRAAFIVMFASTYALLATGFGDDTAPLIAGFAVTALWFALLLRVGLLAAAVAQGVAYAVDALPLTLDLSAWYAPRAVAGVALIVVLLATGFYVSLGGRLGAGKRLLDFD